uniref:Uncharacterized protein n=1 Tax=Lepeophtheirus salmonis TaxID=72036 RepID=A0A0K2TQU5_LEPSM
MNYKTYKVGWYSNTSIYGSPWSRIFEKEKVSREFGRIFCVLFHLSASFIDSRNSYRTKLNYRFSQLLM